MERSPLTRIFARSDADNFVGRSAQLIRLLQVGRNESGGGIALLAAPSAGASELLRQAYDRLFVQQEDVIPFYFEVRLSDHTAQNAALRFLCEFLLQTVAFRRNDPGIIAASPAISEITQLAAPSDGHWIDTLVDAYKGEGKLDSERLFVRNCLSAPLRASVNGARPFVMIDDMHLLPGIEGGGQFLEEVIDILSRSSIPFVLSGLRRFLFARTPFETMSVEPFSFAEAGRFAEGLAARQGVLINDQTRDLVAVQLGGTAGHISSLLASGAAGDHGLNSFDHLEQAYTDEIFGGRISRQFDGVLDRIVPDTGIQANVLALLAEILESADGKIPVQYWHKHAGLNDKDSDLVLDALNYHEIVAVGSGSVEIDKANLVLCDYLRGRIRLELDSEARALVVGESLAKNVKRAPGLMARYYRRRSAIGLRTMMRSFDGRLVSSAMIDYGRFSREFKGATDDDILKAFDCRPGIDRSASNSIFGPHCCILPAA